VSPKTRLASGNGARLALAAAALFVAGLAGVAAGGCTGRPVLSEKPRIVNAWVNIIEPTGTGPCLTVDVTASASITVSTGPAEFCANLEPLPSEAWYAAAVKVKGTEPRSSNLKGGQVAFSFPPGSAGEKIVITLDPVALPDGQDGPLVVTLTRAEAPVAALKIDTGDRVWRDVTPGEIVKRGPLRLLLTFTQEMSRGAVFTELARTGLDAGATWNPDGSLTVILDDPPPVVSVNLWEARDTLGLPLANGGVWDFYVGEPPYLYAYDPASGAVRKICTVPGDIFAGAVNPGDGATLFARAYVRPSGAEVFWLVSREGGSRRHLEGYYDLAWVGPENELFLRRKLVGDKVMNYEVVTAEGEVRWQGTWPYTLERISVARDGKSLAGLVVKATGATREELAPCDLVTVDLETGRNQVFEGAATVFVVNGMYTDSEGHTVANPDGGGPVLGTPTWSPDGTRLAMVADLDVGNVVKVFDPATGDVTAEVPIPDLENGSRNRFSWSPDGRYWTAGPLVIKVGPPVEILSIRLTGEGQPFWSPDGEWLIQGEAWDDWGELKLYRVAPDAGPVFERSLGPALPCGWDAGRVCYFIRWADYEERFKPGW
jgi:hypothetical protein